MFDKTHSITVLSFFLQICERVQFRTRFRAPSFRHDLKLHRGESSRPLPRGKERLVLYWKLLLAEVRQLHSFQVRCDHGYLNRVLRVKDLK